MAFDVQEPTRIIALRHGETAWNVDTRLQGQLDIPLNERGQRQARLAAQALSHEEPQGLWSSDLRRARDTAAAVAASTGLALHTDSGLRERNFGIWQGHTYAEVEQRWPEASARWRRREPEFGPPGGETLQQFYDRCLDSVTGLARRHAGQTLVIVAHGGVLDCLHRAAMRIALDAPRTWELPNTGINRLLYTDQGYTLIGWGDVHHLDQQARDESADRVGSAA